MKKSLVALFLVTATTAAVASPLNTASPISAGRQDGLSTPSARIVQVPTPLDLVARPIAGEAVTAQSANRVAAANDATPQPGAGKQAKQLLTTPEKREPVQPKAWALIGIGVLAMGFIARRRARA